MIGALAHSLPTAGAQASLGLGPSPVVSVLLLAALGMAALAFLMLSSFVKIAVVFSILRSALGLQNIPPTSVITGLALILSLYVMAPTGAAMGRRLLPAIQAMEGQTTTNPSGLPRSGVLFESLDKAKEPLRAFLKRHAHPQEIRLFLRLSKKSYAKAGLGAVDKDDLTVLIPAFVISELKEAFQIGFLLFIPFLVIDILVSNILMALGMHMLSPTTISLPFKILLFVMADGWYLLTKGLIIGYF
jgi:type III secretion protein R